MNKSNFEYWKEVVGLEKSNFPHLVKLDEENISFARIPPSRINEIRKAIAINRIVDIQVQPGWGATTLFRYMENDAKNNKLKLSVLFDFERDYFQNGNLTDKKFIFQMKWKMANGILDVMLNHFLPEGYMYEVFRFEDTGEKTWRAYLREKRRELNECKHESKLFYKNFPFYEEMDISECVNYFLINFQIQTIFMYLFPREAKEDDVLEFVGIIKDIFDGRDILPAAIREVFFITPKLFEMMNQCYERPYLDIHYQQYSAAEIFAMLVNTYKFQDEANTTISDVFEQEFISSVYDKTLTLDEIMRRVEEKIISVLEGEKCDIPFKLELKNMNGRNRV